MGAKAIVVCVHGRRGVAQRPLGFVQMEYNVGIGGLELCWPRL